LDTDLRGNITGMVVGTGPGDDVDCGEGCGIFVVFVGVGTTVVCMCFVGVVSVLIGVFIWTLGYIFGVAMDLLRLSEFV